MKRKTFNLVHLLKLANLRHLISIFFINVFLVFFAGRSLSQTQVTISEVDENIPTYLSGAPEPNPMFFFGKGTQGAEQRIYPYPLFDNLTNKKGDKTYHLVYLENEYIKIGILPELGGRIFSAIDKTNNYDFIYRQHVIKPALIGLTGAWISGGVEWNIPHHHRASTFSPVQYSIESRADGSKTVWVGELEIRHRMRWAVGYTLHPGSSVVDCNVRISNRTPVENTMLCFANIAVSVNKDYQVIFPPRTQWSTGHSKREFNPWPVVNGTDMSWYNNNKSSSSWFAVNYEDDFVAGYDHGKNAGILNIANHHIVAGKKFFTWGVGNMWDKILTDDDGPYLEIMVGAYSDNQPDYSWLQPTEERSFVMSLFPFRGIDGVKNANQEAAVNFQVKDGKVIYGFYTTKAFTNATVTLKAGDKILAEKHITIDPAKPFTNQIVIPEGVNEHDLRASISSEGRELVAYSPVVLKPSPKPAGYTEPKKPEQIENTEELFLAGQRIDQFHNPSLDADPYWKEVLRRDSGNISANTGMGILCLKKAKYAQAEKYLAKAIERLTAQYTIAKNVEPLYYLGLTQKAEGRFDDAFNTLYKAAWKQEWKAPAYYALAEIASTRGNYAVALDLVNQSLDANADNVRAYVLKSAFLRHLNKIKEAESIVGFAKDKCDPLDAQLMAEHWMNTKETAASAALSTTLQFHQINAEEIAAGYLNCGLWDDGTTVLLQFINETKDKTATSPLVYYYLAYFAEKMNDTQKAANYRKLASLQPSDYVFPFQQEIIPVLRSAIQANPTDARAPYYLGNLLYDWQPEEAISLWEKSSALDPKAPITWRNLAIAYAHQPENGLKAKAIACLEKAVNLPNPYPLHFAELDQLYKAGGTPVKKRLDILEKNQTVVMKKDETLGDLINLKIFSGKTDEAISLLKDRVFSIWEGGSSFNTGQAWAEAYFIRGLNNLKKKKYQEALNDLKTALTPPENLRAERPNPRINQIKYWMGCTFENLGEKEKARNMWNEVVASDTVKNHRMAARIAGIRQFNRYYVSMSRKKLDPNTDMTNYFHELSDTTKNMEVMSENKNEFQFIRESGLKSLDNMAYPHFLAGLGYLGLGNNTRARGEFESALQISPDFLSAKIELEMLRK